MSKELNLYQMGQWGNILFGIFHLLPHCDKVKVHCSFKYDEICRFSKLLFNNEVDILLNRPSVYEITILPDSKNPHKIRDINFENLTNKDIIAGYFQVLPDLNIINKYRKYIDQTVQKHEYTIIHVRRGDFLHPGNIEVHPTMSKEYYLSCMDMLPGEKFMFISDDIEWCKKNFSEFPNVYFSDSKDSIEDFKLLLGAKNIIFGNSTYAYFGSLLNPRQKTIIACNKWYTDTYKEWNDSVIKLFENHPDNIILTENK